MRTLLITVSVLFCLHRSAAQATEGLLANKRFIEITGTGETEITPDEIYVTLTLQEKSENRDDIGKQEEALKKNLKDLGIDLADLTLSSADADYRRIRSFKKDVVVSKTYVLKIASAEKLSKVYERLDKINVYDAYISKVDHSKILEFTKENRIKAMKAGKEKAEYLLAAIGQQAGQPLQVLESENFIENPMYYQSRKMAMNVMSADREDEGGEISFKKIKIRSSFIIKYEIK